jgi:arsenate reductase (thioredoxin)
MYLCRSWQSMLFKDLSIAFIRARALEGETRRMTQDRTIIFVCEHGAAKSIIAAAYFNGLAEEWNLNMRAIARGTIPDQELSPEVVEGLRQDGLMPAESVPQKLTLTEFASAETIVSFCELPEEYEPKTALEQWNDIPPVSQDYDKARDAIIFHIKTLVANL